MDEQRLALEIFREELLDRDRRHDPVERILFVDHSDSLRVNAARRGVEARGFRNCAAAQRAARVLRRGLGSGHRPGRSSQRWRTVVRCC